MSDITLHLGGLVLAGAILLGMLVYAVIALVAFLASLLVAFRRTARRIAGASATAAAGSGMLAVLSLGLPASAAGDAMAEALLYAWALTFLAGLGGIVAVGIRIGPK